MLLGKKPFTFVPCFDVNFDSLVNMQEFSTAVTLFQCIKASDRKGETLLSSNFGIHQGKSY
jgi:hypothetical protein